MTGRRHFNRGKHLLKQPPQPTRLDVLFVVLLIAVPTAMGGFWLSTYASKYVHTCETALCVGIYHLLALVNFAIMMFAMLITGSLIKLGCSLKQ
jgi:hypothetical protein